jgi:hypothetical protein
MTTQLITAQFGTMPVLFQMAQNYWLENAW